jgi:hypothetical protein
MSDERTHAKAQTLETIHRRMVGPYGDRMISSMGILARLSRRLKSRAV